MSREETIALCKALTISMLLAYHHALFIMLGELVRVLPPHPVHGDEPYRGVLRRFRAEVRALAVLWMQP